MSSIAAQLPAPSTDALQLSNVLAKRIREEIESAGGWLDFSRYMQLALYTPGLGYYSAGSAKFGATGDFVTAPELGSLLGRALATTLDRELTGIAAPTILELGAGSGKLAAQILDALAESGGNEVLYRILEPSADLRDRQSRALQRFGDRIMWLDRLPDAPIDAVVLANEVLDGLPVSRFAKRGSRTYPLGVAYRGRRFQWQEGPRLESLCAAVEELEDKLGAKLPDGYVSEICLLLPAWIQELAAVLRHGSLLFIDYGLARRDYYHEQRTDGTLICHYRHRAHDDPFIYPGLTDISAWVDFSACADAAVAAGLNVAGFTTQAQFLLGTLAAHPPQFAGDAKSIRELNALKTLVLPGEMGERFKVLLLRKNLDVVPLPGRDFRDRL
jgi:SAM-dependent MidA family methyltransferase